MSSEKEITLIAALQAIEANATGFADATGTHPAHRRQYLMIAWAAYGALKEYAEYVTPRYPPPPIE
jgi:hypothetical protein